MTFEHYVNNIVRPLRAANRRKAKMREELLAHLGQTFTELSNIGLTEGAARAEAIARMGSIDEMRAQLQAIVPAFERALFLRMGGRRKGESDTRYAARLVLYMIGFLTLLLAVPAVLEVIVKGPHRSHAVFFTWFSGAMAMVTVSCFVTFLFDFKCKRAYADGKRGLSYALGLVALEIPVLILFTLALIVAQQLEWTRNYTPYVLAIIAAFGVAMAICLYLEQRYLYPRRPWVEFGKDL